MARKIPWGKILEVVGAGRDASEGGSQAVRLWVRVSEAAPRGLVLAIKEALVAREASGVVDVRPIGAPAPEGIAPDALVVVCGGEGPLEAALAYVAIDEDATTIGAGIDRLGDKLVAQFDEVEILPGVHANGRYTLGENIGDHGGLSIAFTAMENAVKGPDPMIDGFTRAQRFYLSYGAIWAQNITDQEKARLTNMDPHSLAENRVNVSVRNFETFFEAFDIEEGDPMFRPEEERVHIW